MPALVRMSKMRKRKLEEKKEKERVDLDQEAMEVMDLVGCEDQEELEQEKELDQEKGLEQEKEQGPEQEQEQRSSRSKEKPYGDMSPRSHRRYKEKLIDVLQDYTTLEQCDLVMYTAGAFHSPTLHCPLTPGKMAIRLSRAHLKVHLRSTK